MEMNMIQIKFKLLLMKDGSNTLKAQMVMKSL